MFIRAYLRASTEDQNALRAKEALEAFAADHGVRIAASYVENESGTKLDRPELMKLLKDAHAGDILLIEQVDRLSRLTEADWNKLRADIKSRDIRVVALDLPTSWMFLKPSASDEFTGRMFAAINDMLLDMLAAVARKDYTDRRRRIGEGIAKAKEAGVYKGRKTDEKRHETIRQLLLAGLSYSQIQANQGCSRATVAVVAKQMKEQQ